MINYYVLFIYSTINLPENIYLNIHIYFINNLYDSPEATESFKTILFWTLIYSVYFHTEYGWSYYKTKKDDEYLFKYKYLNIEW